MVPLNFLLLNIIGIYNIQYILGTIFALFLVFYFVSYLIGVWRPVFLFNRVSDKFLIKNSFDLNLSSLNYLYIVIQWFSAYFLLSLVIDTVQQFFGIQIGNPLMGNPLLSFLYLSAAPLNEEILFRVIFLGVPLSLIIFKYKNSFFSTLLHPSNSLLIKSKRDKNILFAIIFTNAIFFGFAHVLFGGHYEIGKVTQASLGGLFLGWLYFRYGLVTSILFHWISNYVIFTYELFGSIVFKIPWNAETNNYFLMILYTIIIIGGIIFLVDNFKKILKDFLKNKRITKL
jgi:membrane protease YdiL (CAAX protease family)